MSEFQERLWSELVRDHAAALAYPAAVSDRRRVLPIVEPQRTARLPLLAPRPRQLAAALAAIAAVAAAVTTVTLTSSSSSAAYAVTEHPDGTVTVTIDELTGVSGANAQLAKVSPNVVVVPILAGCPATGVAVPIPLSLAGVLAHIEGQGVRVQPRVLPAGDTLVLAARQLGAAVGLSYRLYQGSAPACLPLGDSHAG